MQLTIDCLCWGTGVCRPSAIHVERVVSQMWQKNILCSVRASLSLLQIHFSMVVSVTRRVKTVLRVMMGGGRWWVTWWRLGGPCLFTHVATGSKSQIYLHEVLISDIILRLEFSWSHTQTSFSGLFGSCPEICFKCKDSYSRVAKVLLHLVILLDFLPQNLKSAPFGGNISRTYLKILWFGTILSNTP